MASDALLEEFEVLESIYPTELSKLSERDIQMDVEPEDPQEGDVRLLLSLKVHYPDTYPDVLPDLALDPVEGDLDEVDIEGLLNDLRTIGEENIGMAMTFTLVSHLRERLSDVVREKAERQRKEEAEKERQALEAEEARTRGTPVTRESFLAWKKKFDQELAAKKAKEEEERLKAMTPKEREEYKRFQTRPTGRQLFERDKTLATTDDSLAEEGTVSVDFSQYERRRGQEEEEEEEHVDFSDSD
ncbi:RWD domain-containing protein [Gloeophyllum trabeum ATCC 11539]|uniref:RWD domain-containing protein n=1 Tax=Gloeophyllum trabeum (strain ATCC 11539 / FP-39264 / Madison 617) TaxID=670483 RepID=S7QEA6_GLOTA|nr:RWD domain-containing protein [Gloeophyllum trabeum ATCC 11539]EPQ58141.1 RWD domain-containing protein [Gloeophyllum trabeum ATCC 11539]